MSDLFISHSSRDADAALELKSLLAEHDHNSVFLDFDPDVGIPTGVSWERTLYTKLRACRAVVALCSDSYLASHWCFAEIALARMEGKHLFVLQIDPWGESTEMPSILSQDQFIDLRTDRDDGYRRLLKGFEVKGIVPAEARSWQPEKPPYPGLRAFERADAPIFFGREEEVRSGIELLNRVRRQGYPRAVMVLGSSGSGKSSLARAGLVPRLAADESRWRVVGPFRPGSKPIRALALALHEAFEPSVPWSDILRRLRPGQAERKEPSDTGPGEVTRELARDKLREALAVLQGEIPGQAKERLEEFLADSETRREEPSRPPQGRQAGGALADVLGQLAADDGHPGVSVVLVIDQFEELLGHDHPTPDRPGLDRHAPDPAANRFLEMLRAGLEAESSPFLVLGTMRSDYLGQFQRCPPLQGLGFRSLSVGPMSRKGMLEVIKEPARLGQVGLEAGLAERLLEETGTSDALPLLAFTLRKLWDDFDQTRREGAAGADGRPVTVRDYEAFGGLDGAIAQVADDTLEAALQKGSEEELRNAFLRLVRPASEGTGWTRRVATWAELGDAARPMLQHFVDQRLLVTGKDGETVEVAHEALFRSWGKLREWLNVNAESLHLLREIEADAAKWNEAETAADKEAYLWRGGRLAHASELRRDGVLTLGDLDSKFVDAAEAAERARRRMKLMAAVFTIIVFLGLSLWALSERKKAVDWIEDDLRNREVEQLLPVIDELIDEHGRSPADVVAALPSELFTAKRHEDLVRLVLMLDGRFDEGGEEKDWSPEGWAESVRCEVVARLRRDRHQLNMDPNRSGVEVPQDPTGCLGMWPRNPAAKWVELDGEFRMGDDSGDEYEKPEHLVRLPAFRIQSREVTNQDYLVFDADHTVGPDSPEPEDNLDSPVVEVTWFDAMAYAIWSGGLLPEEAQWEFAARGTERRLYPWGPEDPSEEIPVNNSEYEEYSAENPKLRSCFDPDRLRRPLPASCSPRDETRDGVHGLGGNVREWCLDRFDYYAGHELAGSESGDLFVIRGGSFVDTNNELRGAFRRDAERGSADPWLGFRVVWPAEGAQR